MRFLKFHKSFFLHALLALFVLPKLVIAQKTSIDSVYSFDGSKKYLYIGHVNQGERTGVWTGKDCATDSIKYYLIFQNGYRMSQYHIDSKHGPMLIFQVNELRDTLTQYMYNVDGKIEKVSVWKILDDSLMRKNDIASSFKGESAIRLAKTLDYTYNTRDITGLTEIFEFDYGEKNYSHYYYKNEFICTLDQHDKLVKGSKKKYKEIMKGQWKGKLRVSEN